MKIPITLVPRAIIIVSLFTSCTDRRQQSGSEEPPVTNATVTIVVAGALDGLTHQAVTTTLAVRKKGTAEIVNGPPAAGQLDGRAHFPAATDGSTILQHYRDLLTRAGWEEGRGFSYGGTGIHFFGIEKLGAGSSGDQVPVNGATDSPLIPFERLLPGRAQDR